MLEGKTYTLIGDSIVKYVKYLQETYVQAYPGTRLEWVMRKIEMGRIKLQGFKVVIIHLGCNNLRRQEPDEIEVLFRQLVNTIP